MSTLKCILGSRSPRRLELLGQIVPTERIEVVPPLSADEADFGDLHDWPAIRSRMLEIARTKCDDVLSQLESRGNRPAADEVLIVITADTTIVATDAAGRLVVLGQPPADETWPETVRHWFREYYVGRTHVAATALCVAALPGQNVSNDMGERGVSTPRCSEQPAHAGRSPGILLDGQKAHRVVESEVVFHTDSQRWLDWYIATGEPRGKAGGYAIQGAGSIFVSHVEGSLSNVVGLPLRELWELFEELGIHVGGQSP